MDVKVLQKAIANTSRQIMKYTSHQIRLLRNTVNFNGRTIQEKE